MSERPSQLTNDAWGVMKQLQKSLDGLLEAAVAVTHTARGNIQLVDPFDGRLRIVVQRGFQPPFLRHFRAVTGSESARGAALCVAMPIVVPDVRTAHEYTDAARAAMLAANALACESILWLATTDAWSA